MRVSRKRVEGCGALASNLQKREVNFSRMLCYIFVRWLDIRLSCHVVMIIVIMIIAVIMIIKNFLQLCCLCVTSHSLAPQ